MNFFKGNLFRNIFSCTVAVFLFILPFLASEGLLYGSINAKFFSTIFVVDLLLIFSFFFLFLGGNKIIFRNQWFLYALGILVISYLLSSIFSDFPARAFWSDIRRSTGVFFLLHVTIFSLLLGSFLRRNNWSFIRRSIALSSGLFSFMTLLGANGFQLFENIFWVDLSIEGLTLGNSSFAGVYLLLAFIITLIELNHSYQSKKWCWILMISLILIALSPVMFNFSILAGELSLVDILTNPFLLLGLTRASSAVMFLLATFIFIWLILGLFFQERKLSLAHSSLIILFLTLVLGGVILLFIPNSPVQNTYIKTAGPARIFIWQNSFYAFLDHPVFGWGPEHVDNALMRHFDSRLYLEENFGEVWVDRSHNIIISTLVTLGALGFLALLFLVIAFLRVVYKSFKNKLINTNEAVLLGLIIPVHFLQLQTAFDTVPSFVLLSVIFGYVIWLEKESVVGYPGDHKPNRKSLIAIFLFLVATLLSFKFVFLDEYQRQRSLSNTFQTSDFMEQQKLLEKSLLRVSDFEGLRLSSNAFINGVLNNYEMLDSSIIKERVKKLADIYDQAYEKYLDKFPSHYRARINYAYFIMFKYVLGQDKLVKAQEIIEGSYILSPNNPLTPSMQALVYFYTGEIDLAKKKAKQAIDINPNIDPPYRIYNFILEEEKNFPIISFLQVKNL